MYRILFTLSLVLVVAGWRLQPEPAAIAQEPAKEKPLTRLYFGVSVCRDCHGKADPIAEKDRFLYRGIEMYIWEKNDKHKDATRVLQGERSRKIAQNLGWNQDLTREARCLSCHGVVIANEKMIHEESFQPAQRIESGVSCVVCHGAYKDWVNEHVLPLGQWKKLTRADKQERFGLRDMWDPATRANLCCSCHVGSAAENKVITHEMYAAGHPPLPGIEVATFCEAMPRHWESLAEKVARRPEHKDFHRRIHGFDSEQNDAEPARLLTVSSVAALRSSAQLVHDLAAEKPQADAKLAANTTWPELAAFDCYACHHDLQSPNWRQLRPLQGKPGRPQLRSWPAALLATGSAAEFKECNSAIRSLQDTFSKTPFGDRREVADSAAALVKACNQTLPALQSKRYDQAAARSLLESLLVRSSKEVMDFDSARQTAWGVRTLLPLIDPAWQDRPTLVKPLDRLKLQLRLDLPKGQVRIAEDFLPQVLRATAEYDPRAFQAAMEEIRKEVSSSSTK